MLLARCVPSPLWRKLGSFNLLLCTLGFAARAAAAPDTPWLEYRPSIGCPSREVFAEELLLRSSYQAPAAERKLSVHIEYHEGTYVGRVGLGETNSGAARQVQNESCVQVVHALALMGALLLDDEQAQTRSEWAAPSSAAPAPAQLIHSSVTAPTTTPKSSTPAASRPIRSVTLGPWLALGSDGLVTPSFVRLGGRVGALLTFHPRHYGFQQLLRISLARVESGTITRSGNRSADIRFTSLRLDLCHGWKSHELTTLAACALFDLGDYAGRGRVDGSTYEKRSLLGRAGGAIYLRYALLAGLSLHADLGLMTPLARPSFVFEASDGLPAETIHQVRRFGSIADLGLELHFW